MRNPIMAALLCLTLAACDDKPTVPEFQGYLEGEYLRMAAPDPGWITGIGVEKGARVRAGEMLFTLDPTRERAQLAEAEAQLAKATSDLADLQQGSRPEEIAAIEAQVADADAALRLANLTLNRQTALAATNTAAQSKVDEARAAAQQAAAQATRIRAQLATARLAARPDRIKSAEAQVTSARHAVEEAAWRLAQREARAPVDALVDDVARRKGEYAPANGVIVSLLPDDGTKVIFFTPEASRSLMRPGGIVTLTCTACPDGLTARIDRVATEAEYTPPVIYSRETKAKLVFRIEALLGPSASRPTPGQPVIVRIAP